jgi:hypothetical protein
MAFDRIKNVVSDVWISIKPYYENQSEYIETDLLYLMDKFDIKMIDDVKFYVNSGINEYGYYFSMFY